MLGASPIWSKTTNCGLGVTFDLWLRMGRDCVLTAQNVAKLVTIRHSLLSPFSRLSFGICCNTLPLAEGSLSHGGDSATVRGVSLDQKVDTDGEI